MAEDNPASQAVGRLLLIKMGHTVDIAENGEVDLVGHDVQTATRRAILAGVVSMGESADDGDPRTLEEIALQRFATRSKERDGGMRNCSSVTVDNPGRRPGCSSPKMTRHEPAFCSSLGGLG